MFGPLTSLKAAVASHAAGSVVVTGVVALLVGGSAGVLIEHATATPAGATTSGSAAAQATIPTLPTSKKGKGTATSSAAATDTKALIKLIETQTGLSTATVESDLEAGQTLAQISGSHEQAIETAAMAAVQTRVNAAVTAGTITQTQATARVTAYQTALNTIMADPSTTVLKLAAGGGEKTGTASPAAAPSTAPTSAT